MSSADPISLNQGKMFIGGLASITTEISLRSYFANFGEVLDPVIMRDKDSNASRGFGFITYRDPQALDTVLSLTPHIVDGKQVDCKRAVPKEAVGQIQQQIQQQMLQQNMQAKKQPVPKKIPSTNGMINIQQPQQQYIPQQTQQMMNQNLMNTHQINQIRQQQPMPQQQKLPQQIQQQQQKQQQQQQTHQQQQKNQQQIQKTIQQQSQIIQEQKQQIEFLAQQQQQFQQQQQQQYQQQQQFQFKQQQQNFQNQKSFQDTSSTPNHTFQNQQDNGVQQYNQQQTSPQMISLTSSHSNESPTRDYNNQPQNSQDQALNQAQNFISLSDSPPLDNRLSGNSNSGFQPPPVLDVQYRKVFVGGLPHNLSDEEFTDYFASYGEIEDSAILKDKRTGKPRGFGFVTYVDVKSLRKVMDLKDSHVIQGKWVDCKEAVPASQLKDQSDPKIPEIQESKIQYQQNQQEQSKVTQPTPGGPSQNYQYQPAQASFTSQINPFANRQISANNFQEIQKQTSSFTYPQNQFQPLMGQQPMMYNSPGQYGYQQYYPQNQGFQQQPFGQGINQNMNDPKMQAGFNSASQPFYKPGPQNNMQYPNQQQQMISPPGFQMMPQYQQQQQAQQPMQQQQINQPSQTQNAGYQNQNSGYTPGQISLGGQTQPSPYFNYNQAQQLFNNQTQFQSGFPYSQTFKQQLQQQHINFGSPNGSSVNSGGISLSGGMEMQNMQGNQMNPMSPCVEAMNQKQQEETEWHIQSLNTLYSKMNLDENDEKHKSQTAQLQHQQDKEQHRMEEVKKAKQDAIFSFNEEIKIMEDKRDEKFENTQHINWQHEENCNKSQISGFYTNYNHPGGASHPQSQHQESDQSPRSHRHVSLGGHPLEEDGGSCQMSNYERKSLNLHQRGNSFSGGFSSSSPQKMMTEFESTAQPQEETSQSSNQNNAPQQNQHPVLKRVESEGNMGLNNQDAQQLRGRHILGSGKNFEYGKDRPSSRASSDQNGDKVQKPEYGQIRSEATQGPSKRSDRQYKPF